MRPHPFGMTARLNRQCLGVLVAGVMALSSQAQVPQGCRFTVAPTSVAAGAIVNWAVSGCATPAPTYLRLTFGSAGWATSEMSGIYVPFPIGAPGNPSSLIATAQACNASGCSASAPEMTVVITRAAAVPVADTMVAADDALRAVAGSPVDLDVLANDVATGATIDPSSVRLETATGAVALVDGVEGRWEWREAAQRLRFSPATGFVGVVQTTYSVANSLGRRSSATVRVQLDLPPPPVASDLDLGTVVGASVATVAVEGAGAVDLVPESPNVDTARATPAGTWRVASGQLSFQARLGFIGEAALSYRLVDAFGQASAVATVRATVVPPAPPHAVDDRVSTPLNTAVQVAWLANDVAGSVLSPIDVQSVRFDGLVPGRNTRPEGTLDLQGEVISFTPRNNFAGRVQLSYTVRDMYAQESAPASVVIEVTAPPQEIPPPFVLRTVVDRGGAWPLDWKPGLQGQSIDLNAAVSGVQSQILTPLGGISVRDGELTLAPSPKASGEVTLNTVWTDFLGRTATVPVRMIVATDNAPLATADNTSTQPGRAVTIRVLSNDFAATATSPLRPDTLALTGGDSRFTVGANGTIGFVSELPGVFRAYYTIKDTAGVESNVATVTVAVSSAPVGTGEPTVPAAGASGRESAAAAIPVPASTAITLAALSVLLIAFAVLQVRSHDHG